MQQAEILRICDTIEQPHFIEDTYLASSHAVVANIIGKTPEAMFLLEHKHVSFPLMLARYQEKKANLTETTRLVYFVLFGLYHNTTAIPELASYLISCPAKPKEREQFLSPWHPFFHAAKALAILTNDQIQVPTKDEVKGKLDTFFERVKRWR